MINDPLSPRDALLSAQGFKPNRFARVKPAVLTTAEKAKLMGTTPTAVKAAFRLNPRHPVDGGAGLTLYETSLVITDQPAATGLSLFAPRLGALMGVSAIFPRLRRGRQHLVTFSIELFAARPYTIRVFSFPLDSVEDRTFTGPKKLTIPVLIPPLDQLPETVEFGARIMEFGVAGTRGGWAFYDADVVTA